MGGGGPKCPRPLLFKCSCRFNRPMCPVDLEKWQCPLLLFFNFPVALTILRGKGPLSVCSHHKDREYLKTCNIRFYSLNGNIASSQTCQYALAFSV